MPGQQFSYTPVDFKAVKSAVSNKRSLFYYPVLFDRYRNNDTTLNHDDFRHLYYGFPFDERYVPYAVHEAEEKANERMNRDTLTQGDFSVIYGYCRELLGLHPFSLRYLLTAAVACSQTGIEEQAAMYYDHYRSILSVILSSGDGATEQSAWSVILVADAYELLRSLGFSPTGEQTFMAGSRCSFVVVSANEYGIEGFYFDISQPFARGFKN